MSIDENDIVPAGTRHDAFSSNSSHLKSQAKEIGGMCIEVLKVGRIGVRDRLFFFKTYCNNGKYILKLYFKPKKSCFFKSFFLINVEAKEALGLTHPGTS